MGSKILREFRKMATTVSPVIANGIMYYAMTKKKLNLRDPQTFNEKLNWLKLNVFPEDPLVAKCADKVAVRDYLRDLGYGHILNTLCGVWDRAEDIDWDTLPDQFVLKCNHGCGYNIVCTDKSTLDKQAAAARLNKWLAEDFWKVTCEPHYKPIPRKILCERYLGADLLNYKFFCFHGRPEFFYISQNIDGDFRKALLTCYTLDGKVADFWLANHQKFPVPPELPPELPQMTKIAEKLAGDQPFVRVDLFVVDGRVYFSELTFTPLAGMIPFSPEETDQRLGKFIDLSRYGL